MKRILVAIAVVHLLATGSGFAVAQNSGAPAIAGTTPDRRPVGAPVVTATGLTRAGLENALHGISEPIPKNLDFLDDQGAWFTPFTRPGMLGVYDIRKFHKGGS